jgi:hypothetical protein
VTLCQSIFMALARTEAKFFGLAKLPLVEIPHHPSGGAREGEHRADAEGALGLVNEMLTLSGAVGGEAGEGGIALIV